MAEPLRLILADDHVVMRAGLTALLAAETGIDIVGEAADGSMAVELAERLKPDVALLDLRMPVMDGVAATREITGRTTTRVLILTTYDTDSDIERAIEAGAIGYLLKDTTRAQLVEAIHAAARGPHCSGSSSRGSTSRPVAPSGADSVDRS